jgi:hypothetical protein
MPLHRIVAGCALLFLLLHACPALAFLDPPWIVPESPIAGEMASVGIHGGVCDTLFSEPGYPQITQEGNAIRMLRFGQHWEPGSGDLLCSYPIGTGTFPVGKFSPGNYTLTVEMAYIDFFGIPQILPIGDVPFTVIAPTAPARLVPATNLVSLLVLALAFSGVAWAVRRKRWV